MIPAMAYSQALFPVFGAEADFPARAVAAAANSASVVRNQVRLRADARSRMLRTRSLR
ncbi:hypothetical protein OWR29_37420 [Actinoplanes sp. Pm04-4]|uniref:Uncharacterized protein n=1 Tax=Paractinoplanes pyxinae TaxID=2997416 RepID=A0ABT4BB68_9ACTN|nr:hypothetical protein [Actinoplanes pyxinae]MCY1143716.1 hypothetical protein [Actinoplanes pyxinae]